MIRNLNLTNCCNFKWKTTFTSFHAQRSLSHLQFYIAKNSESHLDVTVAVSLSTSRKHLSIILDSKVKFKEHLKSNLRKTIKTIGRLGKL